MINGQDFPNSAIGTDNRAPFWSIGGPDIPLSLLFNRAELFRAQEPHCEYVAMTECVFYHEYQVIFEGFGPPLQTSSTTIQQCYV